MAEELDAQWEIKVSVPMRLPGEQRDELFAAVVRAVSDWEPDERDGWDADVAGCPATEWPDLVDLRLSRQAWAEEAMRLELADEARSCTGAGDCRSEVHHEGCLHGDPDASWYCIYPRERVHDPSRDAPALPEADRCTHPECKPTIRAVPWTDDDAELLAVAEARAAADTGERHSLDDVAAEFGVDLGSVLPEGEAP